MQNVLVFFIVVIVLLVGQFFLQYFLSTRESKWLGYLLPFVNILSGMFWAVNVLILPAAVAGLLLEDGISEVLWAVNARSLLAAAVAFLLGGGIGCAIHIFIYRMGRKKVRRRMADRVDKMSIQDLG